MYKLWATIKKDCRILFHDKVGLVFMFVMPIVLAIVITAVQNSTFELVNDNKISVILCNRDEGESGVQLITSLEKAGMFELKQVDKTQSDQQITDRMHSKDALIAIVIPGGFSATIHAKAKNIAGRALNEYGIPGDSSTTTDPVTRPLSLYYHPVLQESFRQSVKGALRSAMQLVESKVIIRNLYLSINEKVIPDSLENDIVQNEAGISEIPVSRDGSRNTPNATQHNIPAWTIFAMFFIVISLGSNVVREKLNGSFVRLKTLPTNYIIALLSKQITYLFVTMVQAVVIFAIGIYLFPVMGLPGLNLPADLTGLFLVSLLCGWCAVSFAICIGVFAHTQEQANGIGAVSVVLMAAVGGLLVPSFAMPASFRIVMKLSPLHWCLEAFYGLFLEGGRVKDIFMNILPLIIITISIQLIALWGLKKKHLI